MKHLLFFAFSCVFFTAYTQPLDSNLHSVTVKANVLAATVYYGGGAELSHQLSVALRKGMQQIVIENVCSSADAKTLRISSPESVVLLSQHLNTAYVQPTWVKDAFYKKMEDSLVLLNKRLTSSQSDLNQNNVVVQRIDGIIAAASSTGKEVSSESIVKLVEYYQVKADVIYRKGEDLKEKINDIVEQIALIKERMQQYKDKQQNPVSSNAQLVLQVLAQSAGVATFNCSYYTPKAGWVANYDLRVKSANNQFDIGYRANVQQTTGLSWKQVRLTLSTSNPTINNIPPVFRPWLLQPQRSLQSTLQGKSKGLSVEASALNEVVVVGYGTSRRDDFEAAPAEPPAPSYVATYLDVKESQLNTNFEIDLPYDIPSDGKQYAVNIREVPVVASFKHFAIPKVDLDAFLIAEISDWEALNLLPGQASIIIDNVFLGTTSIDPNATADTLRISLGRDKRVSIQRNLVVVDNKNKLRGDSKFEYFTFELVVKNNKQQPIQLQLKDQFPVSVLKDVEVTLDNNGNAEVNKEIGELNWLVNIQPGENKKIRFGYSIKYPKEMKLLVR